jgi:hypothetical protein
LKAMWSCGWLDNAPAWVGPLEKPSTTISGLGFPQAKGLFVIRQPSSSVRVLSNA